MIEQDDFYPIIIGIISAVVLLYVLVFALKITIRAPSKRNTIDRDAALKEQELRMNDVRDRQKRLLQDRKQKLRDFK